MTFTINNDSISSLFSVLANQQTNFDQLANSAMNRGIDRYQKGDYAGAEREFRRAIGLSPYSENTPKAVEFIVQSLLKQGKTNEAITAYKQGLQLNPTNDSFHLNLGNIYYSQSRNQEALAEYQQAVRLNRSSANLFSLGQAQMYTGNLADAEQTFKAVAALTPDDGSISLSLGQTYRRMGKYDEAIDWLNTALAAKPSLGAAYFELGLTYADSGDFAAAREQIGRLTSIDQALSVQLQQALDKQERPGIVLAYTTDGFNTLGGPGTVVSSFDSSLATPDASKEFTIHVSFNKSMDVGSVLNPLNWSISKDPGGNFWGAYNWGVPVPSTDTSIAPIPAGILYDPDTLTADVRFIITQNASGTGTLDPSHLVFQFKGADAYGNAMNLAADQFSGLSKIV
jgi:tetratricopeptide (TPR) repeat protein